MFYGKEKVKCSSEQSSGKQQHVTEGAVAQAVERSSTNSKIGGSIPGSSSLRVGVLGQGT